MMTPESVVPATIYDEMRSEMNDETKYAHLDPKAEADTRDFDYGRHGHSSISYDGPEPARKKLPPAQEAMVALFDQIDRLDVAVDGLENKLQPVLVSEKSLGSEGNTTEEEPMMSDLTRKLRSAQERLRWLNERVRFLDGTCEL